MQNSLIVLVLFAAVALCQVTQLTLVGNASWIGNFIRLTVGTNSAGAAWLPTSYKISDGGVYLNDGFESTFLIRGINGSRPYPADGVAFVVHGLTNPAAIGGMGGDMGVPSGSANLVHGFRLNWFSDWDGYDVVLQDLSKNNYMGGLWNRTEDTGQFHTVKVSYQQSTTSLAVTVDGLYTGIFNNIMYPSPHTTKNVYVGLTAACGSFWDYYDTDGSMNFVTKHYTQAQLFGIAQSYDNADGSSTVRLVQYAGGLVGGMYMPNKFPLIRNGRTANDGFVFTATFKGYRQIGTDWLADGFAFLLYNATYPGVDLEGGGGGVGIPFTGATGVKFDWWNSGNYVTLYTFNSSIIGQLGTNQGETGLSINPTPNDWQNLKITYNHLASSIQIDLSGTNNGNGVAYTSTNIINNTNLYPSGVNDIWVGITAATGGFRMTLEVVDNLNIVEVNPHGLTTPSSNKKSSNSKAIGLGVGIPLALIVVALIVVGVLYLRKRGGLNFSQFSGKSSSMSHTDANATTEASLNKL